MDLNQIISIAVMGSLAIGAADYAAGNRLGLGKEFEQGITACGRLILCMAGFMVLAPLIAQKLGTVVSPLLRNVGMDPSILAGMLLANDAGGAALAMELAESEAAGLYSGLIVGSMLGTTVMLNIPTVMSFASREEHSAVIYGMLCGIITIPLGCLTGGLIAGFPVDMILINTVPVLMLSLFLLIMLLTFKDHMIHVFSWIGKVLTCTAVFGLVCGAAEKLIGVTIFQGMSSLDHVFPVVGNISVFLGGAFTLVAIIRRLFQTLLGRVGKLLKINSCSVSALLLTIANPIPSIMLIHEMDDRGKMLNMAFLISAGCVLGDHLAYTAQIAPSLCVPVIAGKCVGGISSVFVALVMMRTLVHVSPSTLDRNVTKHSDIDRNIEKV